MFAILQMVNQQQLLNEHECVPKETSMYTMRSEDREIDLEKNQFELIC